MKSLVVTSLATVVVDVMGRAVVVVMFEAMVVVSFWAQQQSRAATATSRRTSNVCRMTIKCAAASARKSTMAR